MSDESLRIPSDGSMDDQDKNTAANDDFIIFSRGEEVAKRNEKGVAGWLHSPGTFIPFKAGYKRLKEVTKPADLVDGKVIRVGVGGRKGSNKVYLWGTDKHNPDGIEVKEYEGKISINIADFLALIDKRPEVGWKFRYDLLPADKDCKVQPALMILLDKAIDKRPLPSTKKKESKESKEAE